MNTFNRSKLLVEQGRSWWLSILKSHDQHRNTTQTIQRQKLINNSQRWIPWAATKPRSRLLSRAGPRLQWKGNNYCFIMPSWYHLIVIEMIFKSPFKRCAEAMIENGHSALERLNDFSKRGLANILKQDPGENWDSTSLQSCNSHLTSSQSTAHRSVEPPQIGQWPLMQVILNHSLFMNTTLIRLNLMLVAVWVK